LHHVLVGTGTASGAYLFENRALGPRTEMKKGTRKGGNIKKGEEIVKIKGKFLL
jgi:hypothetical protein